MSLKQNVSKFPYCFGCGVCAKACGKNIINMELDKEGFYKPIVDNDRCIDCGICLDVCSFNHKDVAFNDQIIESYAAWSSNDNVRKISSSGGISFELGKVAIAQGYKVAATKYHYETDRAELYIADNVDELVPSIGSKYIQSYTYDGLANIDRKNKYLFIGTPCQVGSFRRYIRKFKLEENFILVDFFCHGVPSQLLWFEYLKENRKNTGTLSYVSWRNKNKGWHNSYNLVLKGYKGTCNSTLREGNLFFKMFFNHYCLGRQCTYDCRFKMEHSSADIKIGDLWGKKYKNNEDGVSVSLVLTEKGKDFINKCKDVNFVKEPLAIATDGQMDKNACSNIFRPLGIWWLRHKLPLKLFIYSIHPVYKILFKKNED